MSNIRLLASRVTPPQAGEYERYCDPSLRAQLTNRPPTDQNRTFTGRKLLTYLLLQAGFSPELPLQCSYGPEGKPFLPQFPHCHFNVSHSGDWVICGLADHPIGVDLEGERPLRAALTRRFAPSEQEMLQHRPPASFFDLWTVKEAFCKCTGEGLLLPLNATTVTLDPLTIDQPGYQVALVPFCDSTLRLALCVAQSDPIHYSLSYL